MKTLDFNTKYKTSYCIPTWLRDEQIKQAVQRTKQRFTPVPVHDGKIAIVGYGPTLRDTWEKLKDFDGPIIACSGASAFLIERGIVPKWHVAVDPLPGHTVKLIGTPHPDVEYLISSTCHQDVFDLLEGFNLTLWHVFDSTDDSLRFLRDHPEEFAVTGGCDAGMRCMTLARLLGFREHHVFGIDGAYPEGGARHAGEHPVPQKGAPLDYKGRTFYTTQGMLESAKMVFHELNQLKDVTATFYGDSLVQEMANHTPRKAPIGSLLALAMPRLISDEYRELNKRLHRDNLAYGVGGGKHADKVIRMAEVMKTHSVLDYGCGKGYLAKAIPWPIWEYDPAIPGKDESPRAADIVVCADVLEHIEPDKLGPVLQDLKRCTLKVGYFVIHTGASSKKLADGRNAHLIQQPLKWWRNRLLKFFHIGKMFEVGPLLHVIVSPLAGKQKTKAVPVSVVPVAAPRPRPEPVLEEVVL